MLARYIAEEGENDPQTFGKKILYQLADLELARQNQRKPLNPIHFAKIKDEIKLIELLSKAFETNSIYKDNDFQREIIQSKTLAKKVSKQLEIYANSLEFPMLHGALLVQTTMIDVQGKELNESELRFPHAFLAGSVDLVKICSEVVADYERELKALTEKKNTADAASAKVLGDCGLLSQNSNVKQNDNEQDRLEYIAKLERVSSEGCLLTEVGKRYGLK